QENDSNRGKGISLQGSRYDVAQSKNCDRQRLGRDLLRRRQVLRSQLPRKSGNFRPSRRWRLLCFWTDLWISNGTRPAMGGRMWRGPRSFSNDDSRRHHYGHVKRSHASDARRWRAHRALSDIAFIKDIAFVRNANRNDERRDFKANYEYRHSPGGARRFCQASIAGGGGRLQGWHSRRGDDDDR